MTKTKTKKQDKKSKKKTKEENKTARRARREIEREEGKFFLLLSKIYGNRIIGFRRSKRQS